MHALGIVLLIGTTAAIAAPHRPLDVTRQSRPACRIVSIAVDEPALLMHLAERAIAETVEQWDGASLPVARRDVVSGEVLAEPSIVLVEWDRLQAGWPDAINLNPDLLQAEFLDRHGFVCAPVVQGEVSSMLVVGRSLRGVYNGAVYLRDFLIDGAEGNLRLDMETVVRTPHMPGRPVYLLTIWGHEPEYTVRDYRPVFESFARDGASHIYFWLSGHFPSKRFPQAYKVNNNNNWDSTVNSRIGTVEDQRSLIRHAHELGMEFFIGGGLGAWCGSFNLTHREPGTMVVGTADEQGLDTSGWALCPSAPRSRRALIDYYKEMYDAFSEADGIFIEGTDEYGECQCERCGVFVGAGSKAFGRNQLSLLRELMSEIWKDHPHARMAYTIGYGPHVQAPAYYQTIRRMSGDPRIEWMEARDSWEFPGLDGRPLPAAFFSPRIMRWDYIDRRPLDVLVANTVRVASTGMHGYIMTFSPGFDSGSFYRDIPFPTDLLPYVLTHFVYREATWEPADAEEMKSRVQRRFFGRRAPPTCGQDLWTLREILRESAGRRITPRNRETLAAMEIRIAEARRSAGPKAQAGLDLMTRAIHDIRRFSQD